MNRAGCALMAEVLPWIVPDQHGKGHRKFARNRRLWIELAAGPHHLAAFGQGEYRGCDQIRGKILQRGGGPSTGVL